MSRLVEKTRHAAGYLRSLHADERGAEGLEKLLIVAAIVLPLLAVLIWFRNDIRDWVHGQWEEVSGEAENFNPEGP